MQLVLVLKEGSGKILSNYVKNCRTYWRAWYAYPLIIGTLYV